MKNLIFKLASEKDLNSLENLIREAYQPIKEALTRPPGALNNTKSKLSDAFQKNQLYTIENEDKTLIGTLSLAQTKRDTVKIYHLAVVPQFQRKGIGRWVINEVIRMVKNDKPNTKAIELEVYSRIPWFIHFYKQLGFFTIGEKEIRNEKILILSKTVQNTKI